MVVIHCVVAGAFVKMMVNLMYPRMMFLGPGLSVIGAYI
jgi:hypothetical protein